MKKLATILSLRTLAAGVVASVLALTPAAVAAQKHFPTDQDLQLMLRYLVEDGETPGIVIGIREADGGTRVLSHGNAGPDARPLGPKSVFEIGSINKTFTGTLLADMVAKGEVALDDPISKYLPSGVGSPKFEGRDITLLDLATHRSGLPRLPTNHKPADPGNPYADYTVEKLYEFLSGHQLRRAPDAEGEYSNLGFGLLGHLLGRAAGMPYTQLVRQRILDPLGMTMTGYAIEGDIAAWHTKGHRGDEVVPYWFATEAIHGAGGLRSNMEDMFKYLEAAMDAWDSPDNDVEKAIRAASELHKPVGGSTSIGLGWQRQQYQGRTIIMHGGGTGGYSTMIAFDPERRTGVIRLANTTEFQDDIEADLIRRGAPLAIPEVDVPANVMDDYAGSYERQGAGALVVRMEPEGWLTLQAPGNVRFRMYPESESKFFVKRAPWRFTFTRNEAGEVVGMTADLEGNVRTARKVSNESASPREIAGNARVPTLPITAAEIARYVGTYALQLPDRTLDARVFEQGGRLTVQPQGQGTSEMLRVGEHEFVLAASRSIRLTFTVNGGQATAMALHQGGGVFQGARKAIAPAALAQTPSFTGKWEGKLVQGNGDSIPLQLNLTQAGTELTGSFGNADRQWAIENGKVDGANATFEGRQGGAAHTFTLTVDGDKLQGELRTEMEGKTYISKVEVTRAK